MFVVFADEFEEFVDIPRATYQTLEQTFAQVCCRAGYNYHFEHEQEGWKLVLADGERPECSPDPVTTDYERPADAKRHLMMQAVDGRLKGFTALPLAEFQRRAAFLARAVAAE